MPNLSPLARAPDKVIAFHGCHIETARHIMRSNPFVSSSNAYDWLGQGGYFWEYAPHRAWEWAHAKFGNDGVILQTNITLGHCLNLLDTAYFQGIQVVYEEVVERYNLVGRRLPSNRADKRHFLDRAVIDDFCEAWVQSVGSSFQTVRGCFPEGDPEFPGSRILRETHVQIAVRDVSCISQVELVE